MKILQILGKLVEGKDLTACEARKAMDEVLSGEVPQAVLAGFLVALRMKGETADEVTGFVRQMRVHAVRISSGHPLVLDTCGTGGDALGTFNISTLAALVIAGCSVPVAKHGNRSVSSSCGSADLLERLGVRIDVPVLAVQRCLEEIGFAFLFAPLFHPSFKAAAPVRKCLGLRTIFNILGPLCNPAGANCQLLGVAEKRLAAMSVQVLRRLGTKRAYVVCGADGMDEVSLSAETLVYRLGNGRISRHRFAPESVGMARVGHGALKGGSPDENAAIARAILQGQRGPKRNAVALNAAFGLLAAGSVSRLRDGVRMAEESLDSGRAKMKLDQLVAMTQKA